MALFSRPRRRAIVASAAKITTADNQYQARLSSHWQRRALDYYDSIGELRYASSFYARQLSRVRIYPATLRDDGTTEPIESGPPVELLNQIQDPGGGRSRLQFDYGRMMFVTGEGILFGDRLETDSERWRFLWTGEVEFEGSTAYRVNGQGKRTGEKGVGYRLWTPHPKHSDYADSPMRAVLDVAEELLMLTAAVRATAVSRLTNGLLLVASELSPPPAEPGGDEDPEQNPFLKAMIDHIQAQIEDPGSAAAQAPFLVEGPYDYIRDGIKWVETHNPQTDYMERDMRKEAIQRLALGLDMPPEVLLGMTDANHWTAKQVQHDMWRSHGVAVAERFCDDINDAFLRPALEEAGYAAAREVVIAYDDSQVVISPDRTEDADNAIDRAAISFKAYREAKGFSEEDAPSEDEVDLMVALRTRNLQPIGIEPASSLPGPPQPGSQNGDAADGPPPPKAGRPVSRQEARTASIIGAAHLALRQCRAKAGARLRQRAKQVRCEECKEATLDAQASVVASILGWEQVKEISAKDPINLVEGGTDEFQGILQEWGIDKTQAAALCQRIEAYAAKTLFEAEQPDLPPGFVSQVEELDAVEHL